MEKTGYYITFRDKEAGHEGRIQMFRYDSKEDFDHQLKHGLLKKKVVVEKGLTETAARQACSKSLREWRDRTESTRKSARRAVKRADQIMTQLEADKGLLLVRSRPHPGSR